MSLQGFLLPGEEKTLQLIILVSHTIADPLNLGIEKLSTLLIVHTIFGQDLFLSLDGEYGTARLVPLSGGLEIVTDNPQNPHASELPCLSWLVCRALYAS